MSGAESLQIMQCRPDPRRVAAWVAKHGLARDAEDLGYVLHALLRAALGDAAPRVFRYLDARRGLLAYTPLTATAMLQRAALADAESSATLGLAATADSAGLAIRPMPMAWASGQRLDFEVRVRPVVREGRTGRELDAHLAAVQRAAGAMVDRAVVYASWLQQQLMPAEGATLPWHGAVDLSDIRLLAYRRLDVLRRTQRADPGTQRVNRLVGGPDAVLTGSLRVRDPNAFAQLLARGVGRHRAFGFGMLLLRPAI